MAAFSDMMNGQTSVTFCSPPSLQSSACTSKGRENTAIATTYLVFVMCTFVVAKEFSDHDFSAVLTLGAGIQTLGFLAMLLKVRAQKTVKGISARTLQMYVGVFVCRLASTMCKNGYLPVDRSGDWAYQIADGVSLLAALLLLFKCMRTHSESYQAKEDDLQVYRFLPACLLLAICTHGDLDNSNFFDTLWFFSMMLDTVALLPQLYMLTKIGGEVDGMTSHFVAAIFASRFCAVSFWYFGFEELTPLAGGSNVAGWTVLCCHGVQLLLSADFMAHYLKSRFFCKPVNLGEPLDLLNEV